MKVTQLTIESLQEININLDFKPTLILCFSSLSERQIQPFLIQLKNQFPHVPCIGCSSGGDILETTINYSALSLTFIEFETTQIEIELSHFKVTKEKFTSLENPLNTSLLKHMLVFTDLQSSDFNFINHLQCQLPSHIKVSGGVAAANLLEKNNNTYIIYEDKTYKNAAIYIGLYGDNLSINYGSHAGWDSYGIERVATKSEGNILYELNGESAASIYKRYLDSLGEKLPEATISYPLSVRFSENERPIIRTVIGLNEMDGSIELAGDIPMYSSVKLMKANLDRIISGAKKSAENSIDTHIKTPQLAIVISCIGRQVILEQLVNEELEVIKETLGDTCHLSGFYSYGEFAPLSETCQGVLHNQTMTITTISE